MSKIIDKECNGLATLLIDDTYKYVVIASNNSLLAKETIETWVTGRDLNAFDSAKDLFTELSKEYADKENCKSCVMILLEDKNVLWGYGNISIMLNDLQFSTERKIDSLFQELEKVFPQDVVESLKANSVSLENNSENEYGYAVLNGDEPQEQMITEIPVYKMLVVVLATPGYDTLGMTVVTTLEHNEKTIKEDSAYISLLL